jgi:hypothetical protein
MPGAWPPLTASVPNVRCPRPKIQQPIQIGKVGVAVDEKVQAFAVVLARPPTAPRLPPRFVRVEVQAPERLPTAMVTAFDVAARAMALADWTCPDFVER